MKWHQNKLWLAALASLLFATAVSADCNDDCMDNGCDSVCGSECGWMFNPPARPQISSCGDFYVFGEALYWKTQMDGLNYGLKARTTEEMRAGITNGKEESVQSKQVVSGRPEINADSLLPDPKWRFGFRVGAGFNLPCDCWDGWDVGVAWTHLHAQSTSTDKAQSNKLQQEFIIDTEGLFAFMVDLDEDSRKATSDWKTRFNIVDFELGREYFVSQCLTFRPHVGVRVANINQRYDVEFFHIESELPTNQADVEHKSKNNFSGAGLRMGFDTNWNLGCDFSIYGQAAGSLVYGSFKLKGTDSFFEGGAFSRGGAIIVSESFSVSRAMSDLALGLQWVHDFCHCRYNVAFRLGWEQHLYFGMNQFRDLSTVDQNQGCKGDLSTQGVTLRGAFNF